MTALKYILVGLLTISGIFTWFIVYTSFYSKPETTSKIHYHDTREVDIKEVILEAQPNPISYREIGEGITEHDVAEWNLVDRRIGIDQLILLLQDKEKE